MPIYVYRCNDCGHDFEELIRAPEAEETLACPACGKRSVVRRFAPFATVHRDRSVVPSCGRGMCPSCSCDT